MKKKYKITTFLIFLIIRFPLRKKIKKLIKMKKYIQKITENYLYIYIYYLN